MQKKNRIVRIFTLVTTLLVCLVSICLMQNVSAEDKEPIITIQIDSEYELEYLPNGVEGCTYPIFNGTATDIDGNLVSMDVKVYYDVDGKSEDGSVADDVLVVVNDNRFVTEKSGVYVIEYIAQKGMNIVTEKLYVDVVPIENYVKPTYEINPEFPSSANTGTRIYLPNGDLKFNESFGNVQLQIAIEYRGQHDCGQIKIIDFNEDLRYFIPTASGEYDVLYKMTDILGVDNQITVKKTITVIDSDKPIIIAPSMPSVFFLNKKVKLPCVEAVQYYDGEIVYVPVEYSFGGNAVNSDLTYVPTQVGKTTLSITAKSIIDSNKKSIVNYDVEVKDLNGDGIYFNKFTKLDGFTGFYREENSEGLENDIYVLEADGSNASAIMSFNSKIAVEFLQFSLGAETKYNNYKKISFKITDTKNVDEQIDFTIEKTSTDAKIYLNGNFVKTFPVVKFTDTNKAFYVQYDSNSQTFTDESGQLLAQLTTYENGDMFNGFSSKKVYVSMEMSGITGKSQLKLYMLAQHYITGSTIDSTSPMMIFDSTYGYNIAYTADINQTVTLIKYDVFDLFDEDIKTKIQIISPNGDVVVDEIIHDDFQYKVEEYGIYEVNYVFEDSAGQTRETSGIIQVLDRISPTYDKIPDFMFEVEVGETYKFPQVKFTDNSNDNCTTWIYLTFGNYQKALVKDNEYKFDKKGEYEVKYVAMDQSGNYTIINYTVVCK